MASDRNAAIILSLRNQADPELRKLAASFRDLIAQTKVAGATQEQAERRALSHAQALSRLAITGGNAAQGERILAAALSQVDRESTAAIRAETQLVATQQRLAQSSQQGATAARQYTDAFKSGLAGIVGPAAVATAAIGGVIKTVDSFRDAFVFKAQLDATTDSFRLQIQSARDAGPIMAQAATFANRYKLTQEELAPALQTSASILRQSNASVEETLGVLLRLQRLSPEQGIEGAALALKELQSLQTTSLVTRFEVSRTAAGNLREEIAGGADAVRVLSDYLRDAGIGMEALSTRTRGAQGALNEYRVVQEELRLAQAEFAQGPGLAILAEQATLARGATRVLSGDFDTMGQSLRQAGQAGVAGSTAFQGLVVALGPLGQLIRQAADSSVAQAAAQQQATAATQAHAVAATGDADASLGLSNAFAVASAKIDEYTAGLGQNAGAQAISAQQAALLKEQTAGINQVLSQLSAGTINQANAESTLAGRYGVTKSQIPELIGLTLELARARLAASAAQGLADQRAGERSGGGVRTQEEADRAGRLNALQGDYARRRAADNKRIADAQAADARRIRDAQQGLDLARAKTSAQRIAILQRELSGTTDIAERLRIQTQIEQERNSAAKGHTSELNKQLSLNERIEDSQAKQARAAIDARLALIDDRKQRILEEQELRRAENAARNARDPRIRELADLARQRIPLEQQQRQLDIAEKLATAGGQIIGGRIFQGQRGAPGALPPLPPIGAVPLPPAPGVGPGAIGLPAGVEVRVFLDSEQIAARIETRFRSGLRAATAGG